MTKRSYLFVKKNQRELMWMSGVVILLCLGTVLTGCVAQQADVVRIKRELDAKISQLDKSKVSLQQAVTEANTALEKANTLIARQRTEIQDLLHARAEVMDQVATLKDTDLSQVRGALEKNQHLVGELDQKLVLLDSKVQTVESKVYESNQAIEPLVQELRTQISAEEQLRAEQGGKLGEFRTSLVDYQQVLTTLRQNVAQQEQQVVALQRHVDRLGQQQDTQYQQVHADVKNVRQHIQTVIGTVEQISTTFSARLDAYEQQRSPVSHQTGADHSLDSSGRSNPKRKISKPFSTTKLHSSLANSPKVSRQTPRTSQTIASESAARYHTQPSFSGSSSRSVPAVATIQKMTRDEQVIYQQALNLLRAKNYEAASREFSRFLRAFPDSALAANSQYWLGECYYGQRRFQEAIDEFERVFTFYPTSNKVPASLLKIGYSHLELQQPSTARSVFQQLVRTYPQSPVAIKAHGRLQEVNALLQNPS